MARNCPKGGFGGGYGGGGGYSGGGGYGAPKTCYSCGGFGHMSREWPDFIPLLPFD
jgi:cellular nucleic acid-binding protein